MLPIRDTIPGRNPPIVTWVLILVNRVVFLFEIALPEPALERFFYLFGLVPARYTTGNGRAGWAPDERLLAVSDQYVSARRLDAYLENMWTLWIFGDNVEDPWGRDAS